MKETARAFTIFKIIALTIALGIMFHDEQEPWLVVMTALVFLCLFTFQIYLQSHMEKVHGEFSSNESKYPANTINSLQIVLRIIMCIGIYISGINELIPVLLILLMEIIRNISEDMYFFITSCVAAGMVLLMYSPVWQVAGICLILVVSLFTVLWYSAKLVSYKELVNRQRSEIVNLNERIKDNQRLIKTIKYAATLEERNRLTARLHDKIGHNISGSILMLEASMLNMKKNPDKAADGIQKAVSNLREGVDDLRQALREERPIKSDINSSHIKLLLEEASAKHNLHTHLKTDGNLEKISLEIWQSIHDNAIELVTNVCKHSNATNFHIDIQVMESMIKVTYWDNGKCESSFEKGLGLEAVEERTIKCNGKCFFEAEQTGFKVTSIYLGI